MIDAVAALLEGPDRQAARPTGAAGGLASLPLMLLLLAGLYAALAGRPDPLSAVRHIVPIAAGATLAALALALPVCLARPGLPWLLPAWLAVGIGAAGWRLTPLPPRHDSLLLVEGAAVLLPFAALCLAGLAPSRMPGLWRAAAASGASPMATLRHVILPAAWPVVVRVSLGLLLLSFGLLTRWCWE